MKHLTETGELKAQQNEALSKLARLQESTDRQNALQRKKVFWLANTVGSVVSRVIFWVLVILLVASALIASAFVPPVGGRFQLPVIVFFLLAFGSIFAAVNGILGVSAKTLSVSCGKWAEERLRFVLSKMLVIVSEQDGVGST